MSREAAQAVVYSDLDTLRVKVLEIAESLGARFNAGWIGTASKKQLLSELLYLLSESRNQPF